MKYRVNVQTIYGSFEVEVIADNEDQAFGVACEEIKKEIDCSKIGSIDLID